LNAALRANPQDASAHYLLGTLYFSRGLTDPAFVQWTLARKFNPNLPVLNASLGLALLHQKLDPEQALAAFRDGLKSDSTNTTIYMGADQALSLLGSTPMERVELLEKYPDIANAPSALIFELILNLSEAGDFQRAEILFHGRFFPREEGGTNVRQVWIEVELQKLLATARKGNCAEAMTMADHLGTEIADLPFTRDGLDPILKSARTDYLLGTAYASCGRPDDANRAFHSSSDVTAPDQLLWAWLAARKLPGMHEDQWRARLQTAFLQAVSRSETSSFTSWWDYSAGTLAAALGQKKEADLRFQKALLLPDRMLAYHLTRLARLEEVGWSKN